MTIRILTGDCRVTLASLPAQSVQCCVTSPPYFGLRDYGHGDQIGLEQTPDAYIAELVAVFREVRRVLRDDGTLWLNLGDSYAGAGYSNHANTGGAQRNDGGKQRHLLGTGLKSKDLIGIPWRVAFALQADGWVLRSEVIWAKPNPMPESVSDRPTKSHEQLFLFAKAKWSGPENGRFAHISDADARWLALLIDAEGSIVVKRNRHDGRSDTFAPQVSVGNTSEALMREVVRIVGHGSLLERPGQNCRMLYWQLANGIARDFLHRIYPFLIVKQRQARIGIYVDSLTYARGGQKPERKARAEATTLMLESLWARNKECNSFGNPNLDDVPVPERGRWADCERYYYDADAIAEDGVGRESYFGSDRYSEGSGRNDSGGYNATPCAKRNKRTVWTVATQPFKGAHFATFPPDLIEPCILAGTSAIGCCPLCGAAWEDITVPPCVCEQEEDQPGRFIERPSESTDRYTYPPVPCAVLDPFGGAGTTGLVADRLGRNAILCELNPAYATMAEDRLRADNPMFTEVLRNDTVSAPPPPPETPT